MTFNEVFGNAKPVIGMIHTNSYDSIAMLECARQEIETYLKYGIYPLIENYFGSANDCIEVLEWMYANHPDATYGVNILGDTPLAFGLAQRYGAQFIQIDSVCGHLKPKNEPEYVQFLDESRAKYPGVVLGGVRFKYQPVCSGRPVSEDLTLGMARCDAIVCTGSGTGIETPMEKVEDFKATVGQFPVIVGAGVTLATAAETMQKGDGAIVGSWFKHGHDAIGTVNEEYVCDFMKAIGRNY